MSRSYGKLVLALAFFCTSTMAAEVSSESLACSANQSELIESGPITVQQSGQIVENMRITSTSGDAILIQADDVVIRNVEIFHNGGDGIEVSAADRVRIKNVSITHTGAPLKGPNPNANLNNINVLDSEQIQITNARLIRGSAGIYLSNSPDAQLSFIEGHDFRGPMPRGQLVQFNYSDRGSLEDFSVENPQDSSFPEDNINIHKSSNIEIRRGLIDGNNSPSGAAVQVEHYEGPWHSVLVEDVDAVRMGCGSFFAYVGHDVTYRRVRTKDNICEPQNRTLADGSTDPRSPSSDGLIFGIHPNSTQVQYLESQYWNACYPLNVGWSVADTDVFDVTESDFSLRDPIRLDFCWEKSAASLRSPPSPPTPYST